MPDLYDRLNQRLDSDEPASGAASFDRLSDKIGADEPSAGITPMDLMDMETDQRSVMLMLLRDPDKVNGVPRAAIEQRFLDRMPDLDATLRTLISHGWLIELGEAPALRYRVNLRARRGAGAGLWSALSDRTL